MLSPGVIHAGNIVNEATTPFEVANMVSQCDEKEWLTPDRRCITSTPKPVKPRSNTSQNWELRIRVTRCGYSDNGDTLRRQWKWCQGRSPLECWSGRRDLNPRLRPWQGRTLPLSYSRFISHCKALLTSQQIHCTRNVSPLSAIPSSAMYCSWASRALGWM